MLDMEIAYSLLDSCCVRTNKALSKPVVVCCVPGFGKTTLIKRLGSLVDCNIVSGAGSSADRVKGVRYFSNLRSDAQLNILDEFQSYQGVLEHFDLIIGDPSQARGSPEDAQVTPHYTGNRSHRIGSATSKLLSGIGYEIIPGHSHDRVKFADPYEQDPEGLVIALSEHVAAILRRHSIDCRSVESIQGLEFDEVSVYLEFPICACELHLLYIALTRHRKTITIFLLNANSTTERSLQEHISSISGHCSGTCHKSVAVSHFTDWWRSLSQIALRWFVQGRD
nr:triple gene block 1 [Grapevine carlavirus 1]